MSFNMDYCILFNDLVNLSTPSGPLLRDCSISLEDSSTYPTPNKPSLIRSYYPPHNRDYSKDDDVIRQTLKFAESSSDTHLCTLRKCPSNCKCLCLSANIYEEAQKEQRSKQSLDQVNAINRKVSASLLLTGPCMDERIQRPHLNATLYSDKASNDISELPSLSNETDAADTPPPTSFQPFCLPMPDEKTEDNIFFCLWGDCQKSFPTLSELITHCTTTHAGKEFSTRACEWRTCAQKNLKFPKKNKFLSHFRLHTGEKPYACSFPNCGKRFTRRDGLYNHLEVHSGDPKYECHFPECAKKYYHRRSLRKHLKEHSMYEKG